MCGIDSADGKTSCGLKLCCSYYGWCGTESVHCLDPEPLVGKVSIICLERKASTNTYFLKTPCQQGFGGCKIIPPPTCDKRSGSSRGRRIAYWQGWNVRERTCDTVAPNQINTRGLTHLFYAFISFDPATFQITARNPLDIPVYGQFTALKRNGLQTWVAVGGWSFNDPGTPTEFAYSNMVSTAANRAAFIKSLIAFMELYGFQGADLDWEYVG
jgi:chitinase